VRLTITVTALRQAVVAVLSAGATAASLGLLPSPWSSWVAVVASGLGGAAILPQVVHGAGSTVVVPEKTTKP